MLILETKKSSKLLKRDHGERIDSSRFLKNDLILTKQEESLEVTSIIYDPMTKVAVKVLFYHQNQSLLEGKIHFIPEELEELERLFDHVKILQAE